MVVLPNRSLHWAYTLSPPSLLAIPCLLRSEDWSAREGEGCPAEHDKLCADWDRPLPDYITLSRSLRRTDEQILTRLIQARLHQLSPTR